MAILSTISTPFPVSDHCYYFLDCHSIVYYKKESKGKYNTYMLYLTQKCYKIIISLYFDFSSNNSTKYHSISVHRHLLHSFFNDHYIVPTDYHLFNQATTNWHLYYFLYCFLFAKVCSWGRFLRGEIFRSNDTYNYLR